MPYKGGKTIHHIGLFPYLGFWASNASSFPKIGQFLIAIPIKQTSPYKTA